MASTLDQTFATNLLKTTLQQGSYTAPTGPVKLALMTTQGSATSNGTEATGGSYARQSLGSALATPSGGSCSSSAAVNFTSMPAATIVAVEVWDSAGTPVRLWQGSMTSKTTNSGDTLSFASGAITFSLT